MLELVPLRFGTLAGAAAPMELLIRVVPPAPTVLPDRRGLNLSLVLDRSGSMQGEKFAQMMLGARQVVQALMPTDRLSVVLFSGNVAAAIPSTLVRDKSRLLNALAHVQPGGNTALEPGWKEGVHQIVSHLDPTRLNRVLLLTDGEANVGECNPQVIAADVARLAHQGVTTSTLGFGSNYNEDLLRPMAMAGDGNHYFVESPEALPGIFQLELGGLMATLGHRVRLTLRAPSGLDLLTPLERDESGALRLNDLIPGNPLGVLVRLWGSDVTAELSYVDVASSRPVQLSNHLRLPVLSQGEWNRLTPCAQVVCEVALLQAAQAREQAANFLNVHQDDEARAVLGAALQRLRALPPQEAVAFHIAQLEELLVDIDSQRRLEARKKAYYGSHGHYKGQYKGA